MRLDDAIAAEPRRARGPVCGIQRIRESFEGDERDRFDQLLEDVRLGNMSAAQLSRILARTDRHYPANNITHHMRGECACGKPQRRPEPRLPDPGRRR